MLRISFFFTLLLVTLFASGKHRRIAGTILAFSLCFSCLRIGEPQRESRPTLNEVLESKRDVWGEAALGQPNGASYEFFKDLLPPPRYVNADFHHYPIVLSAPKALVKARLISNGSGINLSGGTKSWRETGFPLLFRVGTDEFLFGSLSDRLSEPTLAEGWLPIPEISYLHGTPFQSEGMVPLDQQKKVEPQEIYRLEAFASTDSLLALHGVVFVKFDLKQGTDGYIAVDPGKDSTLRFINHRLISGDGDVLAVFDSTWSRYNHLIKARLKPETAATFAVATQPFGKNATFEVDHNLYAGQRRSCVTTWKNILADGMQVETPEPLVNNAYRNSICQIFQLLHGDEMRYSTGNQYDKIYEAEGSDAAMALLLSGYENEMRRCMVPLFHFTRKNLELHHASFKINNLCQLYWVARDKNLVDDLRPLWEKEAILLDTGRTGAGGLYPMEQYCGDIHTFVQSLNVNAQAWRAMRDLGALLTETGHSKEGEHYTREAAEFRKTVLAAVDKVADKSTDPPFVPIALNGGEPAHTPILHSRIGSYWNIIIGYAIESGIFPPGSNQETWIPRFEEQHGGLFMGMLKSGGGNFNFWTGEQRVNPLYGTRYSLHTLLRDDPERALVSFYGMLAQGLTRNTFVGGEGSSIPPVDSKGRFFYCPPNSAASAHLVSMFRNLLVQDWDLDDNGVPETLRLGFATPRRWLDSEKQIVVQQAPTAFGPVSYTLRPELDKGKVICLFTPPPRHPDRTLIRIRVPDPWYVKSAQADNQKLTVDENGTIDVSHCTGPTEILFRVAKKFTFPDRNLSKRMNESTIFSNESTMD